MFKWRIINRFNGYIEPGYLESCRGENTLTRKEKRKEKTQTLRNDTFLLHSFIKASFLSIAREERERDKAKETIYIPFVVPQITRR